MKFQTYLEHITGVSLYPVISLMLFVLFFLGVSWWILRIDKKEIEHMEKLPLDQ